MRHSNMHLISHRDLLEARVALDTRDLLVWLVYRESEDSLAVRAKKEAGVIPDPLVPRVRTASKESEVYRVSVVQLDPQERQATLETRDHLDFLERSEQPE